MTAEEAARIVRRAYKALRWSTARIADFLGVSHSALQKWKSGETRHIHQLVERQMRSLERRIVKRERAERRAERRGA